MGEEGIPKPVERTINLSGRFSCRQFVIRELTGMDEIEIGECVDRRLSGRKMPTDAAQAGAIIALTHQRESLRRSLVSVDGKSVNQDGVAYAHLERHTVRTINRMQQEFNKLPS